MKIVSRQVRETADASAARGTAFRELRRLLLLALLLVVVLYFGISLLVDVGVGWISPATEAQLFGGAWLEKAMPATSDPRLARLETILAALAADAEVAARPHRLVVISAPEPNAFAFPGGAIGVTTALLDALEADIELAFVLGHELGHFQHRDHLRGLGRALGVGVALAVVFGGDMGAESVANVSHYVLSRGYSRAREEAADRFGVGLVYRTYGKTNGVDRLFQVLFDKAELPAWAYMLATHPSPDERIRQLETYAEQLGDESVR